MVTQNADTQAFIGVQDWEFLQPLFIGDTVHVITTVVGLKSTSPRRGRVKWLRELLNQDNKVCQRGHFETLVATAVGSRRRVDPRQRPQPNVIRHPTSKLA